MQQLYSQHIVINKKVISHQLLKVVVWLFLIFVTSYPTFAQNILQQKISISANNTPIKEILQQIEQKGKFYFSYNSELISNSQRVNIHAQNQSVESILNTILGNGYTYQISDNHIIITVTTHQGYIIRGQLIDEESGLPIEYASVYEQSLMIGTISDDNGFFSLQLKQQPTYKVVINKISYQDTLLQLKGQHITLNHIILKRHYFEIDTFDLHNLQKHWLTKRVLNTKTVINSINLNQYFAKQSFQFSVLPGVGSKNLMKSQTINKFSFNLLGGYTAGVRGFEFGTGFNMVQKDMEYSQLAGLFNMVGGNIKGVQISGAYNYGAQNIRGVQLTGLFNVIKRSSNGLQLSGGFNSSNTLNGIQTSGLLNIVSTNSKGVQLTGGINTSSNINGGQISGLSNYSHNKLEGIQLTGGINFSDTTQGVQVSGISNYSNSDIEGVQISGGINFARKTITGVQIAGIFNYAHKISGTQIGIFNYADSSTGLSIGFLSFVKNGKKTVSISSHDFAPYSISYKSGNFRLYNIIQVSGQLQKNNQMLSVGYGIGYNHHPLKKWQLAHELSTHTIYAGNWNDQNLLFRYQFLVQKRINRHFSFYFGPSINVLYHEKNTVYSGFKAPFQHNYPSKRINNSLVSWIGWSAGINLW